MPWLGTGRDLLGTKPPAGSLKRKGRRYMSIEKLYATIDRNRSKTTVAEAFRAAARKKRASK